MEGGHCFWKSTAVQQLLLLVWDSLYGVKLAFGSKLERRRLQFETFFHSFCLVCFSFFKGMRGEKKCAAERDV